MPLGMEVGLGPGDVVLDEDSAPPKRGGAVLPSPQFSAHDRCRQTAGWTKMPLRMEVGLGPGDFALDRDPAPPSPKTGQSPPALPKRDKPPSFRPMSIATKELDV